MTDWHQVPEEWIPRLRAYLKTKCGEERDRLSALDFRTDQTVQLQFDDGSMALFRYAFAIFNENRDQCMVFTEHCGYHIFPIGEDSVMTLRAMSD